MSASSLLLFTHINLTVKLMLPNYHNLRLKITIKSTDLIACRVNPKILLGVKCESCKGF